ncbi:ABC transporter ATP-binding protein [Marinivivus vitaminiproducens]|uniref:ABC transporter ATP-binding protein n=1 Tax=Marinivivus vitaminiproducens TaxID=3035935 RepID=UPI0027A0EF1B|nr:ABC transporter ATP-binding protein [Geminicoccaceae bacterium SCSIO 64248]
MSAGGILLEAAGLSKHFGRTGTAVRAVDGVSLQIRRGETFAIVGESGCGKSTLARLLLRLIEPTEGDVVFDGETITRLSARRMRALRRHMQIVFQDPFSSLNPRMTAEAIVAEPLVLHGLVRTRAERRERVAQLLRMVGLLPDHGHRYPHEFSGGQRQRLGIARALACEPALLIGDEPVSALDVSVQAQIVNLLEDLKIALGLTLVIVAHGLPVIRHMSDRVAVMYLGEIVELAPTDPLFERPLHPYTQALLAAVPVQSPRERGAMRAIEGDVPNPAAPPPGCRFHTRCPHARPLCQERRPKLERAPDTGRSVACHFWREIAETGPDAGARIDAPASATLQRRLALFEEAGARREHAAPPIAPNPR